MKRPLMNITTGRVMASMFLSALFFLNVNATKAQSHTGNSTDGNPVNVTYLGSQEGN